MLLRVVFFVLMAFGLMGFGTVAWITSRPHVTATAAAHAVHAAKPQKQLVLVAARAVHAGNLLKPEDIASKLMTLTHAAAQGVTLDTPEARRALIGSMVRRSFGPGDIVRNTDIMRPGDHGFLAAVLQPGMRAVTISVDNTTGSAGLIWPGDHVDLILTQTLTDPALSAGQRVAAETLLSDIRVLAIDQQIVQGAAPTTSDSQSRTVTLEVTQQQAERISVANRLGRLSLSVRSADQRRHTKSPAAVETTWASDVSRALTAETTRSSNGVVRVFQGGQDPKEFKF